MKYDCRICGRYIDANVWELHETACENAWQKDGTTSILYTYDDDQKPPKEEMRDKTLQDFLEGLL